MGRQANLAISQWFTGDDPDQSWKSRANCGGRYDLPWIDDRRPIPMDTADMADICAQCPVQANCARYGLTTAGGFYAGIWLPWKSVSGETPDMRLIRARARRELRRIATARRFRS